MIDDNRTSYQFESEWILDASIDRVFELLLRPDDARAPSSLTSELLDPGDDTGLGRRALYRIRSPLIYTIELEAEVTQIEPPRLLHSVVAGDLEGTGTYTLSGRNGSTSVRFDWKVATTKKWMNLLAPIARPLFVWAHDRVMGQLIRAMASNLEARLVSSNTKLVHGGDMPAG